MVRTHWLPRRFLIWSHRTFAWMFHGPFLPASCLLLLQLDKPSCRKSPPLPLWIEKWTAGPGNPKLPLLQRAPPSIQTLICHVHELDQSWHPKRSAGCPILWLLVIPRYRPSCLDHTWCIPMTGLLLRWHTSARGHIVPKRSKDDDESNEPGPPPSRPDLVGSL